MICDSTIVLETDAAPRSFAALMTLYESNFLRLTKLVGDMRSLREGPAERISVVEDDFPLHLIVADVARYTTTLNLTYFLEEGDRRVADPDISIRVYHDASLAEAMACGPTRLHPALTGFDTSCGAELRRRWTRNVLLNKWLEYCLDRQHTLADPHASTDRGLHFVT